MSEGDDLDHAAQPFPLEELREMGFDPVQPEDDQAARQERAAARFKPKYVPPPADYATPWRVADYDERVLVLDSEGCSLFEVFPGQARGYVATRDDRRAIAEVIVDAINTQFGDGYAPAFVRRQMEAERRAAATRVAEGHPGYEDHATPLP